MVPWFLTQMELRLFNPETDEGREAMEDWNYSFLIGSHFDGYDQYLIRRVYEKDGNVFFEGLSGENGCPEFTN